MVAPAVLAAGSAILKYAPKIWNGVQNVMSLFGNKSNSAQVSFDLSKKLQEHQYQLNRLTRQTSFQDTRHSLEAAGYNPLLAVGEQAQGGTFGASLNVQDPNSENLQNRLSKIATLVNIASQRSQAQVNSANASLANEQSKATVQDVINKKNTTSAQVSLLNAQTEKQKLDNDITRQYGLQSAKANLEYIKSSSSKNYSDVSVNNAERNLKKAQIGQINATTAQIDAQNSALKSQAEWYKKHPYAARYTQWVNNVIAPTVGSFVGTTQGYSNMRNATGNQKQFVKTKGKH